MIGKLQKEGDERIGRIVQLFKEAESGDYSAVAKRLQEARELVHEQIAGQLEEPLNQHLARMPQDTILQKRDLAKWANGQLRSMGVCIRCPRTGKPSFLIGTSSRNAAKGRFQLCLLINPQSQRTYSSMELFPINLMSNADRYLGDRASTQWRARVTKPDQEPSRS
jgi:hypothetical protein